ncbi:hypothetical protein V490_07556 [Pseudogymnoascus sp. VKM F-3557]|nr:hypothetical protein V490_07556 [Pseudogymnoascus sp. VKM F-3557]
MCSISDAMEASAHAEGDIKLIAVWIIALLLVLCCSRYPHVPSAPGSFADVDDEYKVFYYDTGSDRERIDSDVEEIDGVDVYDDECEPGMEMETSHEGIYQIMYFTVR